MGDPELTGSSASERRARGGPHTVQQPLGD